MPGCWGVAPSGGWAAAAASGGWAAASGWSGGAIGDSLCYRLPLCDRLWHGRRAERVRGRNAWGRQLQRQLAVAALQAKSWRPTDAAAACYPPPCCPCGAVPRHAAAAEAAAPAMTGTHLLSWPV